MRLYYHPASTCSLRVLLTAYHLGIELELVMVDLFQGEQGSATFQGLNPNQKVPVLEHDGFVLWESYAIMQYLADITEGQNVYPNTLQSRADVNRWLFWCGQEFMPGASLLNWENSIKSLAGIGEPDPAAVARGEALLTKAATTLDTHLAEREWLCGENISLADFAIAAALATQHSARFPVLDKAHLQRWFKQIQTLDIWQKAWTI